MGAEYVYSREYTHRAVRSSWTVLMYEQPDNWCLASGPFGQSAHVWPFALM
jgi:hypothetical protein